MTLNAFENALRSIPTPGRNDRQDCEIALLPLLNSAALDPERTALHARHIALGLDLFQETGLRPLFTWVDDRDQNRLPSGILPYTITLISALHRVEDGPYAISVGEMAHRENRLSLLLHHTDIESPANKMNDSIHEGADCKREGFKPLIDVLEGRNLGIINVRHRSSSWRLHGSGKIELGHFWPH